MGQGIEKEEDELTLGQIESAHEDNKYVSF